MKIKVFVRTTFEGFHRWPDAPDEVAFLRYRHRHLFHVRGELPVGHADRDTEFILLKRELDTVIAETKGREGENVETWSCETWAAHLAAVMGFIKCEVSEDGENGAIVEI